MLTDVVPSKTLIATADLMTRVGEAGELGVKFDVDGGDFVATGSYILRPRAPLSWLDPGVFGTLGVGGGFAAGAAATALPAAVSAAPAVPIKGAAAIRAATANGMGAKTRASILTTNLPL